METSNHMLWPAWVRRRVRSGQTKERETKERNGTPIDCPSECKGLPSYHSQSPSDACLSDGHPRCVRVRSVSLRSPPSTP